MGGGIAPRILNLRQHMDVTGKFHTLWSRRTPRPSCESNRDRSVVQQPPALCRYRVTPVHTDCTLASADSVQDRHTVVSLTLQVTKQSVYDYCQYNRLLLYGYMFRPNSWPSSGAVRHTKSKIIRTKFYFEGWTEVSVVRVS